MTATLARAGDPWQAMADPTRRRVLASVAHGPRSVTDIARELPVSRPAVSQHLRVLHDARLVDVRARGRLRLYELRQEGLDRLRRELEEFWSGALANLKRLSEQTYDPERPHQ